MIEYGDCKECKHNVGCPHKPKPLAQYLAEYLDHEKYDFAAVDEQYGDVAVEFDTTDLRDNLKQALDAYESTENVKIRIERV